MSRLSIAIMKDPNGEWSEELGDRHTYSDITIQEWAELYFHALNCPRREEFGFDETIEAYEKRQKLLFQEAIPEYPQLRKIWDMYLDVRYSSSEVQILKKECKKVLANTNNRLAVAALKKLIDAADEAVRSEAGLFLGAD